jgi:hypothetical protein
MTGYAQAIFLARPRGFRALTYRTVRMSAQQFHARQARAYRRPGGPLRLQEQIVMSQWKRLSAFVLALALASVLGCAATETKQSTGEYFDDTWITTKVKAALVEDPLVKATEVNVETYKGVVQLSGFVSSNAAMQQAVKVTKGIKGVTSVRNDMRIK